MNNPVIQDLKKLSLIKKKSIVCISNNVRDGNNIKVLRDRNSGIIFLDKFKCNAKYYKNRVKYDKNEKVKVKIKSKMVKLDKIEDDKRRISQFKKLLYNKKICDYGCGFGNFLKKINFKTKSLAGIEINNNAIRSLKKEKRIQIFENLDQLKEKQDLFTCFHVFHYLPNQIKFLKRIKKLLVKKGKVIIEVPHAKDFLLNSNVSNDFYKFSFSKEKLILHTKKSLFKFLEYAGYKKIQVLPFQRYNLDNHLNWIFNKGKSLNNFQMNLSKSEIRSYKKNLEVKEAYDTLIAIASN